MQAIAHASAKLFDQFFSSLFALYDGDLDVGAANVLADEEPDENHPISHSYFGA